MRDSAMIRCLDRSLAASFLGLALLFAPACDKGGTTPPGGDGAAEGSDGMEAVKGLCVGAGGTPPGIAAILGFMPGVGGVATLGWFEKAGVESSGPLRPIPISARACVGPSASAIDVKPWAPGPIMLIGFIEMFCARDCSSPRAALLGPDVAGPVVWPMPVNALWLGSAMGEVTPPVNIDWLGSFICPKPPIVLKPLGDGTDVADPDPSAL